jgi:putative DNA primase/helicase
VKLTEVLAPIEELKKVGTGWSGRCPAHEDNQASLSISVGENNRVLIHCHAGCSFFEVVEALQLEAADLAVVEVDEIDVTTVSSAGPQPPNLSMVEQITDYCERAAAAYAGSWASDYAFQRFGITEAMAAELGLGYDPGDLQGPNLSRDKYHDTPRLVVPFRRIDNIIVGLQGRRLADADSPKWCGPYNNGDHAWSTTAMFLVQTDDADLVVTEGPADALTAFASNTSAVGIRGAALSGNTSARASLLAACHGRRVLLAGDADNAGQDFNRTLGAWLAEQDVQVHELRINRGGDLSEWRELAGDDWAVEFSAAKRNAVRVSEGSYPPAPPSVPSVAEHPWLFMHRTDDHNGRAFVDYVGDDWNYCPALGWLTYKNGAHRPDELSHVRHRLAAMFDEMVEVGHAAMDEGREIGGIEGEELEARGAGLTSHGLKSLNIPKFEHALKAAQSKKAVPFDQLDAHDHLLVAKNVTIDLRDGTTLDHDPGHWLTAGLSVNYDPKAQCPRWEQFLLDVTCGRPEMVDFLQVLIGYGITGRTSEQVLAVLIGSGSNGKTVLANVLRHVFQPITSIASFTAFEKKAGSSGTSDLASLAGARMVWASEGERQAPIAEALVKRVTGSDPVTCRHLYMKEFTYQPKFLLMLGTNYAPNIGGQDLGIWRRLLMLPFDAVFMGDERDLFIEDKLTAEAEGILAWAVTGASRWYADGLHIPEFIQSKVSTHRETSDSLAGFVGDIVTASPSSSQDEWVSGNDIYDHYRDWAYQAGEKTMSRKALFSALSERLPEIEKFKHRTGIAFRYLELDRSVTP